MRVTQAITEMVAAFRKNDVEPPIEIVVSQKVFDAACLEIAELDLIPDPTFKGRGLEIMGVRIKARE